MNKLKQLMWLRYIFSFIFGLTLCLVILSNDILIIVTAGGISILALMMCFQMVKEEWRIKYEM